MKWRDVWVENWFWTGSPCWLIFAEKSVPLFSSGSKEPSALTPKICFASDVVESSYWSLDGLSDGVVPVSSSGGNVGLQKELTSCLGCDLQWIRSSDLSSS